MKLEMDFRSMLYYMGLLVVGYYLALGFLYRKELYEWWKRER